MEQMIVIVIVLAALGSSVWHVVRVIQGRNSGGSCPGCGNCGRRMDNTP